MKILFHDNSLSERGTSVALFDYARYNQEILGNESLITFNHNNLSNNQNVIDKFKDNFNTVSYHNFSEVEQLVDKNSIDAAYFIKSGHNDGRIVNNAKNLIHAVFSEYDPHGDRYAYVSEWLSNVNSHYPFVPHMVSLPTPTKNLRESWGISEHSIIVGRYGGQDTFDIHWVKDELLKFIHYNPNYFFVFVNTRRFTRHPNFVFLDTIINTQEKSNYLNSIDVFLHARLQGESFGLSIVEALYRNKPVLSWNGGTDKHHMYLLKNSDGLYSDSLELKEKLLNYKDIKVPSVEQFSPIPVMKKFKEVFLNNHE